MNIQNVPSREIMWNVGSTTNTVVMYLLLALSVAVALAGIYSRMELWGSGKAAPERTGQWVERTKVLFLKAFMQRSTNRERTPAIFHSLIYLGFLVLLFTTTMVMLDHDFGFEIYRGDFYLLVTVLSDIFGFGVLFGCLLAAHRRYVQKADLVHNRMADGFILFSIILLVVQGFALEGLRIHVTQDPWRYYSPIGLITSYLFWPLSPTAASLLHFVMWWFHTITVFALFALLPYTKFFHIISSSANLYFGKSPRPKGQLQPVGDMEQLVANATEDFTIGLGTLKDYSWKQLLDLDACTSCGRCQDACPAYIAGKPLSPKWMILDTRNHALSLHAQGKVVDSVLTTPMRKLDGALLQGMYLEESGLTPIEGGFTSQGAFRGRNAYVQETAWTLGGSIDARIAGEVMDPEVFWSCTTCMACVEACPVSINHVDQIIGNRRNMALMHGEIPSEAQGTLRALESRGNPYGAAEDRIKWADGLELPILQPGDSVDVLYWVGCVSSYDKRKQKIARSLVKLMNAAGLKFGILGNAEGCTGDPARRLGEENLFQMMAKQNIELLKGIQFKTLVANCPHCFNTIKNEYPEFGNLGEGRTPEIIHHSVLLKKLLNEGAIKVKGSADRYTFHDPCYLGRYNDEYDAPRSSLKKVKGLQILEMDRSREKGMCCGAGGGHFWMDIKKGERINAIRTDQAAATGADKIATACPFCLQMMEDGVKLTGREESLEVKDIAEVLAENLIVGEEEVAPIHH